MRPLKLAMQAFGPYAGREEIDFRELGKHSFFLIHGPTGGGKTTILDAICFALYGDTSGGTRNGREMRSDYADPETPTEIVFDFSLGGTCYRVHRAPEQERPRRRGEGMTTQKPEATLWKLENGKGSTPPEPKVIDTQHGRVTDRIEGLLGFRSDQFRQVIMLPQGQFQELLLAGSKEREVILEILFQTEIYRRIEEALKAAAKQLTDDMEKLDTRHGFILDQAHAADRAELQQRIENLETDLAKAEKQLEQLRAKEKKAQERLRAGRDLHDKFGEHEEAEKELALYLDAGQEIEAGKARLRFARKAAGLTAVEETMRDRLGEAEELGESLRQARLALEEAKQRKTEAARLLGKEKRREARRKDASKQVIHLEGLAGQITQVESARTRMESLGRELEGLRRDVETAGRSLGTIGEAIKSLERSITRARQKAEDTSALRLRLERSRKELEQRRKLDTVSAQLKDKRKALRDLDKNVKQAQARLQEARDRYSQMEDAWREGQAGLLAATLLSGKPCPVCGSTEHPHPAHLIPEVPDQHRLQREKATVEECEKQRDQTRETRSAGQREISRLEAEVRSLEENLGKVAGLTLRSAESVVEKLKQGLQEAQAAERAVKEATDGLEIKRKQEADSKEHLETGEAALKKAENAFEGARAVVAEREGKLPKTVRTRAELDKALEQARTDLKSLLDAFEKAREQESDTGQQHAEAKAALEAADKAAKAAARKSRQAQERFSRRLEAAGFSGPEAYEDARLEESEIDHLAREIDEHEAGLKAAGLRLTRARQATRGKKRPDLVTLESKAEDAKTRCDEKITESAEIRKEHEHLAGLGREWASIERKIKTLKKRYCVAGKIAEVANGKNDPGIAFQRFVLAALLDDVLRAATKRLKLMSRDRFNLHRAGERADRRHAGGLDLEVYDAFTGSTRPVSTLSGGETFLAALSLALGLADVVQARAGGIHLETIFVDEGFGSLDPEALDLAVRALMDLQKGNRLVGIISHVPELKERIDVRLEVRSTRRGSYSRFVGT